MRKLMLGVLIAGFGFANASMSWTCYRLVNGEPTGGFVKVMADTKQEATKKAIEKYKKLGYNFDGVNCK